MTNKKRLIVGISGATGAVYGVRILEILSRIEDIESHLVLTKAGKMTIQVETPYSVKDVEAMADVVHDVNNVGASISSGSFRTEGMVIAPCSMTYPRAVCQLKATSQEWGPAGATTESRDVFLTVFSAANPAACRQ